MFIEIETVSLFKDGEKIVVNAEDAAQWKADGWKTKAPKQSTDTTSAPTE